MKNQELRELNSAELAQKEKEKRHELFQLRLQAANQQLKNPLKLREVRREIARIMTINQEKAAAGREKG